jgi:uncharacterized protein
MHDTIQVLNIAWQDLLDLGVYFFLALAIAALVDLLMLDILARRSFKKHGMLGILFTTSLGAFSPFCSFTVIPLIRRLLRGGVPLSAVMAFWIASPAMDPPIFALTAKEIGLPLALARLIGALVLSISAGTITLMLERRGLLTQVVRGAPAPAPAAVPVLEPIAVGAPAAGSGVLEAPLSITHVQVGVMDIDTVSGTDQGPPAGCATTPAAAGETSCGAAPCQADDADDDDGRPWWPQAIESFQSRRNWKITARNIAKNTISLGKWLIFACLFQGVISVFVPAHFVTAALGGRGLVAIPLSVLVSVPLYLNGIGAIPIVGGLLAKGMIQGAAVSFLLGGAVTTIPAMVAVHRVVNNKVFALYLSYGIFGSILLGMCAELILGAH